MRKTELSIKVPANASTKPVSGLPLAMSASMPAVVEKPPFVPRTRGEKLAQAAGVILQALVLSILLLSALAVLVSYIGTKVVFRYQNF